MRHRIYYRSADGIRHGVITSHGGATMRRVLDDGGTILDVAMLPRRPDRAALEKLGVHCDVAAYAAKIAPSMGDIELARWARDRAEEIVVVGGAFARSDYASIISQSWYLVSALAATERMSLPDD